MAVYKQAIQSKSTKEKPVVLSPMSRIFQKILFIILSIIFILLFLWWLGRVTEIINWPDWEPKSKIRNSTYSEVEADMFESWPISTYRTRFTSSYNLVKC